MIKQSKYLNFLFALLFCISLTTNSYGQTPDNKLSLSWSAADAYNAQDNLSLTLLLKNDGAATINLDQGDIWFNAIYPIIAQENPLFSLSDENGNLFRIRFAKGTKIKAMESLVLNYVTKYPIVNVSMVPNGFYYQDRNDPTKHSPIAFTAKPIKGSVAAQNAYWASLYEKNQLRQQSQATKLILPSPKSLAVQEGSLTLSGTVSYTIDDAFLQEQVNLADFAFQFTGLNFYEAGANADIRISHTPGLSKESYNLRVDAQGISIEATEAAGVFYGLQSIRSMLTEADFNATQVTLPYVQVQDEPRYAYRGFMMDIARNFKDKQTILKYLDVLARYKINTFHFHFIDDEGWRIEIPSLPELTQVGANRSPLFQDGKSIQPAYGSGDKDTKSHYLSRQDFIEILRYAKQRHITVVPEIETPGHARASIKAMESRYQRLVQSGNRVEAEKYLLHDLEDNSVYSSAQYWNDNIMNVALPSVYAFLGVVLDDFKQMYTDAGLSLEKVSLGGDEVPNGVWERSPKIKALMTQENLKSVYEVWPYYINKVNKLCQSKGLQLVGWEEMGMVNQGKGMGVNPALAAGNMQLDVWNNLIGGGQEDLAYKLANAGYKTVYISANNNYFDMAWATNFEEPGLKWASYADLYQSYSFLPENFFASIALSVNAARFPADYFKDKERLTAVGRKNLVGIKGGLWAETIQTTARMDYMVFPRFFALAERAWAPRKAYEDDDAFSVADFNKDYSQFVNKLGLQELPKLARSFAYRLPAVGVKEIQGKLHANTEYPGFAIHYTTDGSMPTASSPKYSEPVAVKAGQHTTFVSVAKDNRTSLPTVIQ